MQINILNDNNNINLYVYLIITYFILMISCVINPLLTLGFIIVSLLSIYLFKKPKRLIYAQIIYNCIIKILISDFNVPSFANYYTDFLTLLIVLAIFPIIKESKKKVHKVMILPIICILALLITGTISCIINRSSIMLYLWSFRNIYRFYAFFIGCAYLLKKEDIGNIFKILLMFLLGNVISSTYQYFIQGLTDDYVGGLFGTIVGGNGSMNVLLCQITIFSVVMYLNKNKSIILPIIVILLSLYISTISELKMYYIEIAFIVLLAVLLSKISKRTIMTIMLCVLGAVISIPILYELYPNFEDFFNIETVLEYSGGSGYATGEEDDKSLNRFTAIQTIKESILEKKSEQLIGIGMGNGETSQFSMFNSEFYKTYGEESRYNWFSHSFMFIEGGYVGLILYFVFFICIFIQANKVKFNDKLSESYLTIAKVTAIICLLYGCYDAALRIESSGYIIYIFLAIPFILANENVNKINT